MTTHSFSGSSLAFLILAAITGFIGFFIVYHYASFERPIQRFAVVIDAGSTQTRSNLYSISLDPTAIADAPTPAGDVIKVSELSSCVNGGPLASIGSPDDATNMLGKCLPRFARKIKRLDFLSTVLDSDDIIEDDQDDDEDGHPNSAELDRRLAILNHRVNSVTHIHLGATAGMRALALIDPDKAKQKIHWMREAIEHSNANLLSGQLFMNPGFVDIIAGTSEASFGWLSVNFACDKLIINTGSEADTLHDHRQQKRQKMQSYAKYSTQEYSTEAESKSEAASEHLSMVSIGTLELGGASAQMAFEVPEVKALNESSQTDSLELFGNNYHLTTRSDLCLGMSQAILRTNYILMREYFDRTDPPVDPTRPLADQAILIENPCQQNGSRSQLTSAIIDSILNGACLDVSTDQEIQSNKFKQMITSPLLKIAERLQVVGTGDVDKCDSLLGRLIEPGQCRKSFSLCPDSKSEQKPPEAMPFVTISGYNKALQVLNLRPQLSEPKGSGSLQLTTSRTIGEKLGAHPIDYRELDQKTRLFCALKVEEFPVRFPKMNKNFYNVNCLQMVYIKKLLTEFYHFKPESSNWNQIRFSLFPVGSQQQQLESSVHNEKDKTKTTVEIGWTLGLLLNATNWELSADSGSKTHEIIFHHGASIQFIIRATVFLMFACVFISGSIIVFSVVLAKRKYRSAYVCHSSRGNAEEVCPPNSL